MGREAEGRRRQSRPPAREPRRRFLARPGSPPRRVWVPRPGGYISHADLKTLRLDRSAKKTRFSQSGYVRALQGHSTDCGHDLSYMAAALDGVVGPAAGGRPGRAPRQPLRGRSHAVAVVRGPWLPAWQQSSSATWRSCSRLESGSLEERTVSYWRTLSPQRPFSVLAADNQRGHCTEVLPSASREGSPGGSR